MAVEGRITRAKHTERSDHVTVNFLNTQPRPHFPHHLSSSILPRRHGKPRQNAQLQARDVLMSYWLENSPLRQPCFVDS